jgi:ubiquitin C-terminal hydrolase
MGDSDTPWGKYKGGGLTGLANCGNTCFLNSTMQVLSHTYELNALLDSKRYKDHLNRRPESILLLEWDKLRQMMWSENCTIAPNGFVQAVQKVAAHCNKELFTGFAQNDLPEFLTFIREAFHQALHREVKMNVRGVAQNAQDETAMKCFGMIKTMYQKEYSELIKLFYGISVTEIRGLDDEVRSANAEPFNLLSLPIPAKRGVVSLMDCLDLYARKERMTGDNAWRNDKTGEKEDVDMLTRFWMLPELLVIDLKRFDNMAKKNKQLVTFPLDDLDLSRHVCGYNRESYVYELYGVCNHTGGTTGGHYTASVKVADGTWHGFDDTRVTPIRAPGSIVSPAAYCFFYRKKI